MICSSEKAGFSSDAFCCASREFVVLEEEVGSQMNLLQHHKQSFSFE